MYVYDIINIYLILSLLLTFINIYLAQVGFEGAGIVEEAGKNSGFKV